MIINVRSHSGQKEGDTKVVLAISGTTLGGIDVQRAIETDQPMLHITGVDHTKEHHVTLTAFNKAGLYTTRTYIVTYS